MSSCFCHELQSCVVCTCWSSWEVGVGVVSCSVLFFVPVGEPGVGVGGRCQYRELQSLAFFTCCRTRAWGGRCRCCELRSFVFVFVPVGEREGCRC